MNIQEYRKEIVDYLEREYSDKIIEMPDVTKNNGVKKHAIIIRDKNSTITPTIYVDDMFTELSVEDAARCVQEIYEKSNKSFSFDFTQLYDFRAIKEKLRCKLISSEFNRETLKGIPHIDVTEKLCAAFYLCLDDAVDGRASIGVTNALSGKWGKTEKELFQVAIKNTQRDDPLEFMSMEDILDLPIGGLGDSGMYVLSTHSRLFGASALLYDAGKCLDHIMDRLHCKSLLILPSSVHEVIVLNGDKGFDVAEIKQMVMEINRTSVERNEWLSNDVFTYDKENGLREAAEHNYNFERSR